MKKHIPFEDMVRDMQDFITHGPHDMVMLGGLYCHIFGKRLIRIDDAREEIVVTCNPSETALRMYDHIKAGIALRKKEEQHSGIVNWPAYFAAGAKLISQIEGKEN